MFSIRQKLEVVRDRCNVISRKRGALGTGPCLETTDLKDGDSTAGRVPICGETGANTTDPSSFSTNTGAGETDVA